MSVPGSDLPTSILFCRLCQSLFRQPRVLPCLHTFCLDCLTHLAPTPSPHGHPSTLPCPLCGQHAPLPPAGVSELTSNDFLARICQEYVGEVQKTLVSRRTLSPAAGVGGRPGQVSPVSVIAGRVPVSQFHYPSPPQGQPSSPPIGSPGAMPTYRERALSPSHSPLSESSFRGRPFSRGMSHGFHRGASPASSPGYLSPSAGPSSPRHSCSSSSSEAVLRTARRLSSEVLPSRGFGIEHRLSTTPQEVVRTWECLQRKLNSLQSASLQVTYSLETLNMAEANWHQRKQDLRRDVQRRSAQLQFFIKRQERLLLAALDARKTDDSFNSTSEQARGELRTNLKALMHETDVVKSVLDLATDSEIMALSRLILTSRVSQAPVTMDTPELHFVMPEEVSLEEMVGRDFGCLTSTLLSHTIFTPEHIRQELPQEAEDDDAFSADTSAPLNLSSAASPSISDQFDSSFEHVAFMDADEEEEEEEEEMVVEETLEFIDGKMQVVSKRSIPSSSSSSSRKRPSTDSRARQESDRELSTRGRATDTRRTVNSSAFMSPSKERSWESSKLSQKSQEEHRPKDTETPSPADSSSQENKMEKFQNLRESLKQKRRELLLNTPLFPPEGPPGMAHLLRGEKRVQSLDRTGSMREDMTRSFSSSSSSSSTAPKRPQEPSIAAPVIHTPTHSKNVAEGSATSSVSSDPGTVLTASLMSTSLLSPRASVPSADTSSRPVRRAISAASDRASKMEYLRETWRKRKELLIQNEAYIPAPPGNADEEKSGTEGGAGDAGSAESEGKVVTSSQPPKSKIKHSIRSRISHLKQALKMNGKSEEGSQAAKTGGDKDDSSSNSSGGSGGGGGGGSDIITSSILPDKPITAAAQAAAEKKVLKTLESILQKTAPGSDPACKPALSSPPAASDTSPGSKPSMLVKPCPREPTAAASATTASAAPLETLPEDDVRGAQAQRKPGLRVTSPVRGGGGGGDASKETLQHLRANIRQKKERWRSLSLN